MHWNVALDALPGSKRLVHVLDCSLNDWPWLDLCIPSRWLDTLASLPAQFLYSLLRRLSESFGRAGKQYHRPR